MESKNNTNSLEKTYRKVVFIDKRELVRWTKYFSLFGSKAEFAREHGIYPATLNRILEAGKGEKRIVDAIRIYIESQKQTA